MFKIKLFLIISFLCSSKKIFFNPTIDLRLEAMGSTGMVFGEEIGSFFCAPTSLLCIEDKSYSFKISPYQINFNNILHFLNYDFNYSASCYLKLKNFAIGLYNSNNICSRFETSNRLANTETINFAFIPLSCNFSYKKFYFGLGSKIFSNYVNFLSKLINLRHSDLINGGTIIRENGLKINAITFNGLSIDCSILYNSFLGKFTIGVNNIFSYISNLKIKEENKKHDISYLFQLMPNLKLGYGRKFKIERPFNSIKLAIELDNLLMEDIHEEGKNNYNFLEKIKTGSEFGFEIGNVNIDIRVGLNNFLPTAGLGFKILKIFELNYSFSNKVVMEELKFFHGFSVIINIFK